MELQEPVTDSISQSISLCLLSTPDLQYSSREVVEGVLRSPSNTQGVEWRTRKHNSMDGDGGRHCAVEQQQPQVICVLQTAGNLCFVFLPCTIKNLPAAIAPWDFE